MNIIEKRTRLITIREDIEHIDSKIAAMDAGGNDYDRLKSVSWHLQRAAQILHTLSYTHKPKDMCSILEASIEAVRGRKREEFAE